MKRIVFFLLALITWSGCIGQELITDRPDQTESSVTVPFRSLQIESGLLLETYELGGNNIRTVTFPATLFRYGILKGIELRIQTSYGRNKEDLGFTSIEYSGFNDIEIGAKINVLNKEEMNTRVAFLSHIILPTGTEDFSSGKAGSLLKFAVSHTLTESIGIGYNIGYGYWGTGSGDLIYSLVAGYGLTDKLSVFLETYGDLEDLENFVSNVDTGLTWLLKENLQLDFSFGTGISRSMNFVSCGFSWNINEN